MWAMGRSIAESNITVCHWTKSEHNCHVTDHAAGSLTKCQAKKCAATRTRTSDSVVLTGNFSTKISKASSQRFNFREVAERL